MSDSVRPHRRQPTRLCRPWGSPGKNTGVGCHFLLHHIFIAIYYRVLYNAIIYIQPVHPKGNQSWVFIGRTDAEAESLVLGPPDVKNWLIWKDPDAGKDWGREEKGTTEDEMVGWHHWLTGQGFGWTPGAGDGLGGLVCCSSWGRKESDAAEWLNWTEHAYTHTHICMFPERDDTL